MILGEMFPLEVWRVAKCKKSVSGAKNRFRWAIKVDVTVRPKPRIYGVTGPERKPFKDEMLRIHVPEGSCHRRIGRFDPIEPQRGV